jgi:hypothetical protein
MGKAVRALEARLPKCSGSAEEFWERACAMPVEEHKKHGRVWAMQNIIYLENQARDHVAEDHAGAAQ